MMGHLQANATRKVLVAMLKKMKISHIEGKNVDKIVGLVRTMVPQLDKIVHPMMKA